MEFLKKIVKECFRYRLSGIAMMSCLILSMLAANYGITMFQNIVIEQKEENNYEYHYSTCLGWQGDMETEFPCLSSQEKCNLKIMNLDMYDNLTCETHLVDVIVTSYKENIPLISGKYADEKMIDQGKPIMLVGRNIFKNAYERDGKWYYTMTSDEYEIIGVIGSQESIIFDNLMILYKDCLGEHTKVYLSEIGKSGFTMKLESDSVNTDDVYTRCLEQYSVGKQFDDMFSNYYYSTAIPEDNEKEYCIIIYLFSFICISFVIEFWLSQRMQEMKICRAFGFSNRQIISRIIYSYVAMLVISILVTLIIMLLIQNIFSEMITEYQLMISWKVILGYFLILFISTILVGFKHIYTLLNKNIVERF